MFGKLHVRFSLWNLFSTIVIVLVSLGLTGTSGVNAAVNCESTPFDPANFSNPTTIDNEYFPMVPGTKLILEGSADRGGGSQPHQVIFIVTDLTKVINGVRTVVVFDRDIQDGQLAEQELAFFAQDDEGNVWNVGEYPEEFEDGQMAGAPNTWIAGLAGAEGGIHMHGTPKVGGPRYSQGYVDSIEFWDCAKVLRKDLKVEVPAGKYRNVLLTDEVSPFDPGSGHQRKYHAPGIGIVKIGAVGDPEAETLSLVRFTQLDQDDLREVRQAVMEMDASGYTVNPDVYGQTAPMEYIEYAPGASTLVSPSASITSTTPAYTWNTAPGATWYYLWVSKVNGDGSLTTIHAKWYTSAEACTARTCSITPDVALSAGDYRWWIQTWNDGGYGPWSSPMNFGVGAPGVATLVSPSGGITVTTPTYEWNNVNTATWYYLWVSQVNADGSFTTVHSNWYESTAACSGATCSIMPAGVTLTSGNYRWWTQTWTDVGYGPWSDGLSFSLP